MIRILQQDNRFTKAIFAVIIGATIVLMVIFLVPGLFDNGGANDATVYATIKTPGFWGRFSGSTQVKQLTVERQTQQEMQQQHLPDFYKSFLMARVGQQMVERDVLKQEADRLGLQVSDADLRQFFQTGALSPYLFPDGHFIGEDQYISFVEQYFDESVADFEADAKTDLELQRLQALVTSGVTVSDAAVRADYMQQGTKVKFDYAVISADDIKKSINPSDADLQVFFQQNAARYAKAVPEERKLELFAFQASDVPGATAQVSDTDVQAYYAANQAQYKVPAEVKTRHILIAVSKDADAKTVAAARDKAADVLKQLNAGGNFADLAKKYSDDPGSKAQGGELPMIATSQLDPAYAQAAMQLNPGQTSGLVRSQFGFHIIQTEAKQPASTKPLDQVKPQIVAMLQQQKVGAAEQNYANQLAAQAQKEGMDKAAAAHNLHVITTDFLPKTGVIPSLADSSAVLSAAFGMDKGAAPQAASTQEGFAIFKVVDIQPAHAPTFDAYKDHILSDYRDQKAPELLNAQLIKLSGLAKQMGDLKKAAAQMNLTVQTSDPVGRDAQVTGIGALSGAASVVFSLPQGGISGPVNEGPNGSVLQLVQKQEPTPDDIAKNLPATREKLLQAQRADVFNVFAGTIMDRYDKAGAIIYSAKQPASPIGL